jgi:hypothetical protein
MAAQAKISSSWTTRIGLMVVLFLGFGLLGVYDGFVKYPEQKERWDAYQQYMLDNNNSATGWDEFATAKGWPSEVPGEQTQFNIYVQYVIAAVCVPVGLAALIWLLMNLSRKQTSDDTGFSAGGAKIPYGAVTRIDKSRWDNKAIAMVHYNHNGQDGVAKIDDWKFKGAGDVLRDIEQHMPKDA